MVWHPAHGNETCATSKETLSIPDLSRQNLPQLEGCCFERLSGAAMSFAKSPGPISLFVNKYVVGSERSC